MRYFFLLLFFTQAAYAQKIKISDSKLTAQLKEHIYFLADDKLEGRRAGTVGEKIACGYITARFEKAGLLPAWKDKYVQPFLISEEKYADSSCRVAINGNTLSLGSDFLPFSFSAEGDVSTSSSLSIQESGAVWCLNVAEDIEENKDNPHFDIAHHIRNRAEDFEKKGAAAVFIFNNTAPEIPRALITENKEEALKIPVVYISKEAHIKFFSDSISFNEYSIKISFGIKTRTGMNVAGFIDNKAPETVVLGAHYDHLGLGEDKNSLYGGKEKMIHNGADDNASGVAALIELAALVKSSGLKKYNYVFVAFSGEELGLFGSKYFIDHAPVNTSSINYMINMDMVGRLKDSSRALTVGGWGTSPDWPSLVQAGKTKMTFTYDSSGVGPSDHTSFYRKNIPVLFFFTGLHGDYHKPSDDADKINYEGALEVVKLIFSVIKKAEKTDRLVFTKTAEKPMTASASFKVSLGIMPDYTFPGRGVRVEGISEGKAAQKAGMLAGDIVLELGDFQITDLQNYMSALARFKKGDKTHVKIQRGSDLLLLEVAF